MGRLSALGTGSTEVTMTTDPAIPARASSSTDIMLRRFLGGMSIFTMLMTIPQVLTI
jgi:hypothetical protein